MGNKVAVVMGSDSDWGIMKEAVQALKDFGIESEASIVSAHRSPQEMFEFASQAKDRGFSVLIAGAGGAAHLPGMLAALTSLPVIGVPVSVTELKGFDSMLSILQMPKGVPVATVAINGAFNAGLLAVQILAQSQPELYKRLETYRENLRKDILSRKLS
ncbi:MAG: 5-(carboxyamino)imidazole ribonucleotide mutase [Bradymonadales bacterium]|nr:MAG: 5-(carboxyamino)imidazole ribonucleotide mutase [Bradymonadales bacterium]